MRAEGRWLLAGTAALLIGAFGAEPFARIAAPFYEVLAELWTRGHPWTVRSVEVMPGSHGSGAQLMLTGTVARHAFDSSPAARVRGRVDVGEVIETPLVFWTVLLMWPAGTVRQRLVRAGIGLVAYVGLECLTTTTQLVLPLAQASAILAGEHDPVTLWDRWSRFLEAGGQFVLAAGSAILLASITARGRPAAHVAAMAVSSNRADAGASSPNAGASHPEV